MKKALIDIFTAFLFAILTASLAPNISQRFEQGISTEDPLTDHWNYTRLWIRKPVFQFRLCYL